MKSVDRSPQLKDYYEKYWTSGRAIVSGERQSYASSFAQWMHAELKNLPLESKILEVGCGDASFTRLLAQHASGVTAVDIAAGQISQNTRRYPAITFLAHDVSEALPFADNSFDVIWCSEVLEHLLDPLFALAEMHRVLAAGGRLLVTVPFHGRFKNVMIALFKWDRHFTPSNPHIRFYTKNTIARIAREAGFGKITMRTCGMNKPLRDFFIPTNILLQAAKG